HRAPVGTPMARVPLDQGEITALGELLRAACGSAPHPSYLARVFDAYRGGASVGDAYVALLRDLLEPLEIGVLDASHSALTQAAAPLVRRAAREALAVAE